MRGIDFLLLLTLPILASCTSPQVTYTPPSPVAFTAAVTITSTATTQPTATVTPIPHVMKPPSWGDKNEAIAHDTVETESFERRSVTDGDSFRLNLYERPFTAQKMDYLPFIDIKDFIMTSEANWYITRIILAGMDDSKFIHGSYGAEFDLNVDGRAEFLVFVENPGLDWTTERVRVYLDGDGDVGGAQSGSDETYSGNGFETLLFDSGRGNDPDLAWAKFENGDHPIVDIAIKRAFFQAYSKFMWSVIASEMPIEPAGFYLNDSFTEESAGSPDKGSDYYPPQKIAAFDNTCRIPVGFQASGREPLGCTGGEGKSVKWTPGDIDWCETFSCPQ